MAKQYAEASTYEAKLEKVMQRFGVEKYDYNWDRFKCYVEFWFKGQFYRFEHSIENAQLHGSNVRYGSDVFAQVVLTLEDIARMTERGIYELQTWVAGLKALPKPQDIPRCLQTLGFSEIPSKENLKARYRQLAKIAHPDSGGDEEYFVTIKTAYEEAKKKQLKRRRIMNEKITLKSCPFCGTDLNEFPQVMTVRPVHSDEYLIAKIENKKIIGSDSYYAVQCIQCGSSGKRGMTKEVAIEAWNRRTK